MVVLRCWWVPCVPGRTRKEFSHWNPGSLLTSLSYFFLISVTTAATLFFLKKQLWACHLLYRNSHSSQMSLMLKRFKIRHPLIFPPFFPILPLLCIIHLSLPGFIWFLWRACSCVAAADLCFSSPLPHHRFLSLPQLRWLVIISNLNARGPLSIFLIPLLIFHLYSGGCEHALFFKSFVCLFLAMLGPSAFCLGSLSGCGMLASRYGGLSYCWAQALGVCKTCAWARSCGAQA